MDQQIKTKRNLWRQISSAFGCIDNEYFCAKIILMIFKIFGLAPLAIRKLPSVEISNNLKREKFTSIQFAYSKLGCFYNILLIIFTLGISFLTIPLVHDNNYPYKSELTQSIEFAQSTCGIAIVIFLFLFVCAKQNCQVELLNRLMNVNDHIIGLSDSDRPVDGKRYFFLLFLVNALVWVQVMFSDVNAYGSTIVNWVNDLIPSMIINWFIIEYVIMVKLIKNRFQKLNRILLDTSRSSTVQTIQSLMMGNVRSSAFYVSKIVKFRRAYASLYEISCEVSDFYALPILVTIAFSCYSVVYNAYFLIMPFVLRLDGNTIHMITNSVAWLIGLMLPITMLAVGVDRTTVEVFKNTFDALKRTIFLNYNWLENS